jgi:hypothetical protein
MAININNAVTVTISNDQLNFDERIIATLGLIQNKSNVKQAVTIHKVCSLQNNSPTRYKQGDTFERRCGEKSRPK